MTGEAPTAVPPTTTETPKVGTEATVPVSKQVIGSTNKTTINPTKTLKVYFQRWPGTDAASGIEESVSEDQKKVKYTFTVSGNKVVEDKTLAAGGLAALPLPANKTGELEILGTKYTISHNTIEAKDTIKGQQRRLNALAYELGTPGDAEDPEMDRSTLNFQADDGTLMPTGAIDNTTRDKLDGKVS